MNAGTACIEKKQSVAQEILGRAERLASISQDLAQRTTSKLDSVTLATPTAGKAEERTKDMEAYPPLFEQLRDYLVTIERSLDTIASVVGRAEL